ncbi:MAG: 3-isopropylmalate dehydratase small subunit [Gemmatimonadetes bacterium]|jgi:3-isopropylmalate/(R)-2-methylmalate dehydratase small subunit|nr:3-isopropylmalate dehydratase small subunit [Gemmatimonadota bacterium]
MESKITQVQGSAVPVRGPDIDTDRIIPARYLRTVTFENLGEHAFEDDRVGGGHPFDDSRFQDTSILVANANFGCGSSREHAPQALMRWGIKGFVAQSFAEIFFGNCVALGLPCMIAAAEDVIRLQEAVDADPTQEVVLDLEKQTVSFSGDSFQATLPNGPREQFMSGNWDSLGQLLEGGDQIDAAAARLPYTANFATT